MIDGAVASGAGLPGGYAVRALAGAIAAMLIFMVLAGCASQSQDNSAQPNKSSGTPAVNKSDVALADNKTAYDKTQATIAKVIADGTYESNVTYAYHSGVETVDIKVTVKDDVITSASVTGNNPNMMSARIIGNFNNALPDLVVGKKINELNIPRNVAGSSLTTAAFKQYVNGLIAQ